MLRTSSLALVLTLVVKAAPDVVPRLGEAPVRHPRQVAPVPYCESFLQITQYPSDPSYQTAVDITVEAGLIYTGDCVDPYDWFLDWSTFSFTVNGADVTSYFSFGWSQAVATGVPLTDEQTAVLVASRQGHDSNGNPRTDTDTRSTYVDATPVPSVSITPLNGDAQLMGPCVAACFAATYTQSTVPYFTLDAPRSITLVYHGDRVWPRPFIHVDVTSPGGTAPQRFWLQAKIGGALQDFTNGETTLYFAGSSQQVRLGGQLRDSTRATGVFDLELIVSSQFPSKTEQTVVNTRLMVVNEASSAIASGWTLAGIQRLHVQADGSALITEGDGSAVYFRSPCSNCGFTTPMGDFSSLTTSGGSYTRAYPDSTKVLFDATGRMVRVTDRFGNRDSVSYDGSGRVSRVMDPVGSYHELQYGANGLSSITAASRVSSVTVLANRTLTAIRDPDGDSTRFEYDGSARLWKVYDRAGSVTRFVYRAASAKLDSIVAPAVPINGGASQSPTLAFSPWQTVSVPTGATSGTPFTPIATASVKGTVSDPEGHATSLTVDRWGQAVVQVGPANDTTALTRDGNGLPTAIRYPWGATASFTYDYGGRVTSRTPPGLATTNYRYGAYGQVDSIGGQNQATTRIFLGTGGRADSVMIAGLDTLKTRMLYDSRGRLTRSVDPSSDTVWVHYDATFGNLDSVLTPGGRFSRARFDRFGRDSLVQRQNEPWGRIIYDALNRVTELHDTLGAAPSILTYDKLFLVRVRDPLGQVYRFAYNALGWPERRYDPADTLNRYDAYRYDRDGRLVGWTNRRGQALSYSYDALDRLLAKWGQNTLADSFGYAPDFRRAARWNGTARDSVFLSGVMQVDSTVTRLAGYRYRFHYGRTSSGALDYETITSNSGLSFAPRYWRRTASTQRIDTLRLGTLPTQLLVNRDNLVERVTWPTSPGLFLTSRYTRHHQSYQDSLGEATTNASLGRSWAYDSLSRVRFEIRKAPPPGVSGYADGRHFEYDRLARLREERYVQFYYCSALYLSGNGYSGCSEFVDSTRSYTYDAVGNRTDNSGTYGLGNRIQSFAGFSFEHDLDGNLTRRLGGGQDTRFYWSAEGRLDSVSSGGTVLQYRYDAAGRLAARRRNGSTERYFLWDGDQLLAELGSTGTQRIAEYTYYPGIDRPLALVTGSGSTTTRFFIQDRLGNVTGVVTGNSIAQSLSYDAWGRQQQVTGTVGDTNRLRWKGLVWEGDVTQLYYMRNRWYEPRTGRFIGEDPIGLAGGINEYSFAYDDPVGGRDPHGLCVPACAVVVGGAMAAGGLASTYALLSQQQRAQIQSALHGAWSYASWWPRKVMEVLRGVVAAAAVSLWTQGHDVRPPNDSERDRLRRAVAAEDALRTRPTPGASPPPRPGGIPLLGPSGSLPGTRQVSPDDLYFPVQGVREDANCREVSRTTIGPVSPGGTTQTTIEVTCDGRRYTITIGG